jgi:hypothetical protein
MPYTPNKIITLIITCPLSSFVRKCEQKLKPGCDMMYHIKINEGH